MSVRNFFPAFRIFVYGHEVTQDVVSCSTTWTDEGRAPGTAEFVLVNLANSELDSSGTTYGPPHERYVITDTDIVALSPKLHSVSAVPEPPGYSFDEAPSYEKELLLAAAKLHEEYKRTAEINLKRIPDEMKRSVLLRKVMAPLQKVELRASNVIKSSVFENLLAVIGFARSYAFQTGDCIFSSNDPVRIFWRDPRPGPVRWYHMFAGYVTDTVDDVDENNQATVTIRCEDALRVLRYARIITNPGLLDGEAAVKAFDESVRTFYQNGFSHLTLTEFLFTIVFGSDPAGTTRLLGSGGVPVTGVTVVDGAEVRLDGAGAFNWDKSAVLVFGDQNAKATSHTTELVGKERPVATLAEYQTVVDHEVRFSDLTTMLRKGESPATAQTIDDVVLALGERTLAYPVDGRLIMLLPSQLTAAQSREVLVGDFINGIEMRSKWTTRLGIILDVMERIEFSFYASPKGDLLCEMPLRDFVPSDFGTAPASASWLTDLKLPGLSQAYGPDYVVASRDTLRWSKGFADDKVRTLVTCSWFTIPATTYVNSDAFAAPGSAIAQSLIPQFGVRQEEAQSNCILVNNVKDAEVYAQLTLNRLNADARTANWTLLPQLALRPNRPILFQTRQVIGTVRSVTNVLTWGKAGDMSVQLRVNWVRGWAGRKEPDGRRIYEFLGGFESNFLNYAVLLAKTTPAALPVFNAQLKSTLLDAAAPKSWNTTSVGV